MNWEDEGILLLKKKFRENANIVNIFTKNHGKTTGIVYGGNSRKIKNYLQIGNRIHLNHKSKNDNKIGYFQTELIEPISPKYFDDKIRSCVLGCTTSMLNSLLPDFQRNTNIYETLNIFYKNLDNDNFIIYYLNWEIELIKQLGFGINIENKINFKENHNNLYLYKIDEFVYEIPKFLVSREINSNFSNQLIKKGLTFTRNLFFNKIFNVNNIQLPRQRIILEKYF